MTKRPNQTPLLYALLKKSGTLIRSTGSHLALMTALVATQTTVQAAPDAIKGKELYQSRCAACHALDFNGLGPAHRGVFGRQVGKVGNYNYSAALKASSVTWNEASLERWLADPEAFIPGQKMGLNLADAVERADVIAYMKQIPAKK
jgi:cytochrome c